MYWGLSNGRHRLHLPHPPQSSAVVTSDCTTSKTKSTDIGPSNSDMYVTFQHAHSLGRWGKTDMGPSDSDMYAVLQHSQSGKAG